MSEPKLIKGTIIGENGSKDYPRWLFSQGCDVWNTMHTNGILQVYLKDAYNFTPDPEPAAETKEVAEADIFLVLTQRAEKAEANSVILQAHNVKQGHEIQSMQSSGEELVDENVHLKADNAKLNEALSVRDGEVEDLAQKLLDKIDGKPDEPDEPGEFDSLKRKMKEAMGDDCAGAGPTKLKCNRCRAFNINSR